MKKIALLLNFFIILFFVEVSYAQQVYINEMMSSNSFTIADEDGDFSDWIEIYNSESTSVDLSGYGLSDDVSTPYKWILPSLTIAPKDHLLIFASDKNKN